MSGDRVKSMFFDYDDDQDATIKAWMRCVLFDIVQAALESTPDGARGTETERHMNRVMLLVYFEDLTRAREDATAIGDELRRLGMAAAQVQVAAVHNRMDEAGDGWRGLAVELADIREDEFQRTYDESVAASAKA